MATIRNILIILIIGIPFIFSSPAFSQSTPPLDKPVEKPQTDQMSESGRIQERNDIKRRELNSPDSDENHPNNPNVNQAEDHSDTDPKSPSIKLRTPLGTENNLHWK
ncbi:MAG: hypothetical protein E6Q59_09155 [Nitrosomonas sp.]|nr:hypothetical protein [Nitrosomonas sp.]TXI36575.1 MAG: hypothetical protein E6Q59_09155 [Nitrosomonas sp.]